MKMKPLSTFTLGILLASAAALHGQNTYVWTGGGDNDLFSTADNWNMAPVDGRPSFLGFDGAARLTPVNDFEDGTIFGGILFNPDAGNFILSGNTLHLGDNDNQTPTIGSESEAAIVIENDIYLDEPQARFNSTRSGSLTLNGLIWMPATRTQFSELLTTGGTVYLTNPNNNFNSGMGVIAGRLVIETIADAGEVCAIGVGDFIRLGNANVTGTIEYTGNAASTNRTLRIGGGEMIRYQGGGVIASNGTGPLTFTAALFNEPSLSTLAERVLTLRGTYAGEPNVIRGVIADNHPAEGGTIRIVKLDDCTWQLDGDNTYSGTTTVTEGGIILNGAHGAPDEAGETLVAAGARIGGSGSGWGNLTLDSGAKFIFIPGATLALAGDKTLAFAGTFGVDDLVNADGSEIDWSTVPSDTHTLVGGPDLRIIGFNNVSHTQRNPFNLSGGRRAYFQEDHLGSLQFVLTP